MSIRCVTTGFGLKKNQSSEIKLITHSVFLCVWYGNIWVCALQIFQTVLEDVHWEWRKAVPSGNLLKNKELQVPFPKPDADVPPLGPAVQPRVCPHGFCSTPCIFPFCIYSPKTLACEPPSVCFLSASLYTKFRKKCSWNIMNAINQIITEYQV